MGAGSLFRPPDQRDPGGIALGSLPGQGAVPLAPSWIELGVRWIERAETGMGAGPPQHGRERAELMEPQENSTI
ncbi:hypothetical protein NDU88_004728 [Pleurodeles waltl]|uniref:Uncharacterized protein n=1 Tax=Pleurodeles waltl TaxID=8319 RepID=A0AAV7TS21_PLEWA|nr:hypothetical protein NDU88_004728 [Pleurodeles waltl]